MLVGQPRVLEVTGVGALVDAVRRRGEFVL